MPDFTSSELVAVTQAIASGDGWVAMSATDIVADGVFEGSSSTISIRHGSSGSGVAVTADVQYPLLGVNLADVQVSTSSGSDVTAKFIGSATRR